MILWEFQNVAISSEKTRMMGLADGERIFTICLAVLAHSHHSTVQAALQHAERCTAMGQNTSNFFVTFLSKRLIALLM